MPQNGKDVNISAKGIDSNMVLYAAMILALINLKEIGWDVDGSPSPEAVIERFCDDGKIDWFPRLTSIISRSPFEMNGWLKVNIGNSNESSVRFGNFFKTK